MKQTVSAPVAVAVILVIAAIVGFFYWKHMNPDPAAGPPKEHTLNTSKAGAPSGSGESSTADLVQQK